MSEVTVDIDLYCEVCDDELELDERRGKIRVTPCKSCLESAQTEGYKEGQAAGYEQGQAESESKE